MPQPRRSPDRESFRLSSGCVWLTSLAFVITDEWLAAVDAYVAPASAVPHDVNGQRSDISWSDDVPDGQHHAQPGERLTPECANLAKPAQNQVRGRGNVARLQKSLTT